MRFKSLIRLVDQSGVRGSSIEYRGELDGLRAIAITGVVLNHVGLLAQGGWGVDLFFLLSGYLITKILMEKTSQRGRLRVFYIRRFARLVPIAMIYLMYSVVVLTLQQKPIPGEALLSSIFYYRNFYELKAGPWDHYWSLSAEEQFYLLWPVALVFFARSSRLRSLQYISFGVFFSFLLLGQVLVISDPGINSIFQHVLVRPSILLAGCALAIFETRNTMSSKKRFAASSLVLGLILCILEFFSSTNIWTFGVLLIGASLLIDSERNGNLLKRMLRVRPLPQVGLLSYSIYIWHFECIRIAKILSSDDQVIMGATFFALLVLFSLVSFNFIEKPIQRFIVNRFSSPISKSK